MLILYKNLEHGPFHDREKMKERYDELKSSIGPNDHLTIRPDGVFKPANMLVIVQTTMVKTIDDLKELQELIPRNEAGKGIYHLDYVNDLTAFQSNLEEGDRVYWKDPDNDVSSGVGTVCHSPADYADERGLTDFVPEDAVISVLMDSGSGVEAPPHELFPVTKEHLPDFVNEEGMITFKDSEDGPTHCLGYIVELQGKLFEPNFGMMNEFVTKEEADKHNEILDQAVVEGLKQCQVGQSGTFYLSEDETEVCTFLGRMVSKAVIDDETIQFEFEDMTFQGQREPDAQCFDFARTA